MSKVFIRKTSECYSLLDNETGEITELQETFVINEEQWIKVYAGLFFLACDKITGQSVKTFIACLKHAQKDSGEGNFICTSGLGFQKDLSGEKKINISRCLKELCDNGLLTKVRNSVYRINPQIAYCGDKASRAKLILKIMTEK